MSATLQEMIDVLIAESRSEGILAADLAHAIKARDDAKPGSRERKEAAKLVGALRAGHDISIKKVSRERRRVFNQLDQLHDACDRLERAIEPILPVLEGEAALYAATAVLADRVINDKQGE